MLNPYQPTFPMPYQQPQQSLQFVNGIESARMYQLPPNSSQILMDREKARFYLVETDASGQKSVQAYDFKAVEEARQEFATVEQFEQLRGMYESVAEQIQAIAESARPSAIPRHAEPRQRAAEDAGRAAQRADHARADVAADR